MGFVVLPVAAILLCVVLFLYATFILPAYVGIAVFIWALKTGAGIGAPIVGLLAGAAMFGLGRLALASNQLWLRLVVIAAFVIPAALAGYGMVLELSALGLISSPLWQHIFALLVGAATAATMLVRLMGSGIASQHQSTSL